MAVAGFCRACGQYVWLNEQWGCVNGHPWSEISNWYDPQTGTPVTPYWLQAAPAPAPAPVAQPAPQPAYQPQPMAAAAPAPTPAPFVPAAEPVQAAAPAPQPVAPAPMPEPIPQPEMPAPAAPMPEPVAVAAPEPIPAPEPVPTPEPLPEPLPAPTASGQSDRLTMLADMLATLGQYPNYRSQYGTDTDIVIDNQIADANWGVGKKKVEFSAIMKAVEPELTIYYWEIVKESGGGLNFGGFESEMSTTSGTKRWGKTSETIIGPNGVAMDYSWDYGATRSIVESVAAKHGWKVKTVLQKKSAAW